MQPGDYEVEILAEGYQTVKLKTKIYKDQTTKEFIELKPTIETLAKQVYKSKLSSISAWKWTSGIASLVSLGFTAVFHKAVEDARNDYNASFILSEIRDAKERFYKNRSIRNAFLFVALTSGTIYLYNVLFRSANYQEIYEELKKSSQLIDIELKRDYANINTINLRLKICF